MFLQAVHRALQKVHGPSQADVFHMPSLKTEGYKHAGLRQFFAEEREILVYADHLVQDPPSVTGDLLLWNGGLHHARPTLDIDVAPPLPCPAPTQHFGDLARALAPTLTLRLTQSTDRPLVIRSLLRALKPVVAFASLRLVLAEGVSAEVHFHTESEPEHLQIADLTLDLAPTASLRLALPGRSPSPSLIRRVSANLERGARLHMLTTPAGDTLTHEEWEVALAEGASVTLGGLIVQKNGCTSLLSRVRHQGRDAQSQQLFRSAVFAGARVSIDVQTDVAPNTPGTQARQETKHLLLEEGARAYTVPRLDIHHDDVVASHGATMGFVAPELLSYMASRGIGSQRAKALLAYGHMTSLMHELPVDLREDYLTGVRSLLHLGL